MVSAPQVEDPREWDFEYNDREEMIFKQNALNQWRFDFSEQLKTMCSELDIEFQFVEETRIDITKKAGQVAADRQHVDQQKQAIDSVKTHVDQQREQIDITAGQVDASAQQVATDKAAVAQDKQAAAQSASAANDSAGAAQQAKSDAENLYGDLDAVRAARDASEQSAQTSGQQAQAAGQERAEAETARGGAEEAQRQAIAAAEAANVDIDKALENYVPRSGADLGGNGLKAQLTHNSGYFYIGAYNSSYGTGSLRIYWNDNDKQLEMGGATLTHVNVRNSDVIGRKAITNMNLVGPGSSDTAVTVFALQADGRSPTIRDDVHDARASGMYYGLSPDNAPGGWNGHYHWSNYNPSYQKFLFLPQNVANRLFIGGNHNGVWSTPVEVWTADNLKLTVNGVNVGLAGLMTAQGLNLPNGVELRGITNGLEITRPHGSVEIGNRNSGHTHYLSSADSHYFYGKVSSQSGFYGDGSNLTEVDARKLEGQLRTVNAEGNTVVGRSSVGDISARLFRSNYNSTNESVNFIYTTRDTSGDFMRPSTPAQVRAALNLGDLEPETGSNSNGRYFKHPDGRLVMHCGVKTFSTDLSTGRYLLANVTLPYTPHSSAEHYVTLNGSSDAGDYSNGATPLHIGRTLTKPARQSGGSVVEVRVAQTNGSNYLGSATAKMSVLIESRWK